MATIMITPAKPFKYGLSWIEMQVANNLHNSATALLYTRNLEDLLYNGITKVWTTHGFMSGSTMASSIIIHFWASWLFPFVQISNVHCPLSSHRFVLYPLLHHSRYCLNELHTIPPLLPPADFSHMQNNWHYYCYWYFTIPHTCIHGKAMDN